MKHCKQYPPCIMCRCNISKTKWNSWNVDWNSNPLYFIEQFHWLLQKCSTTTSTIRHQLINGRLITNGWRTASLCPTHSRHPTRASSRPPRRYLPCPSSTERPYHPNETCPKKTHHWTYRYHLNETPRRPAKITKPPRHETGKLIFYESFYQYKIIIFVNF